MRSLVVAEEAVAYGLFSRQQALTAGHTGKAVAKKLRTGEWVQWAHGLYRVADRPDRDEDPLVRAVLRAGPLAAASHLSAAAAWGWDLLTLPDRPHVTVPRTHCRVELPNTRLYRRALARHDVTCRGVLPVTTPARTGLDIALDVGGLDAPVAVDSALRARNVSVADLESELASRRTSPRYPVARSVLGSVSSTSGSVPESLARLLFSAHDLPAPIPQFEITVDGRLIARVDFAWPELRLVVEIDGFTWHSSRDAFQNDRTRQNELVLAGWTVLRFTAAEVRARPGAVVATVAAALGRLG